MPAHVDADLKTAYCTVSSCIISTVDANARVDTPGDDDKRT